MAYSNQRTVSNGTLRTILLSITFFDKSEISVFVNDVKQNLGVNYTWATDNSIQFPDAIPAGTVVIVRRNTDISEMRHIFTEGAQFTNQTLDEDYTQILHIAQESVEGGYVTELFNDLDMHNYKIRNLGPAVLDKDALSLGQAKTVIRNSPDMLRTVRASMNEPELRVLPTPTLRADKLLGFNAAGQPVTVVPDASSGTSLGLALAGPNGSELVGHGDGTVGARLNALDSPLLDGVTGIQLGGVPKFGLMLDGVDSQIYPGAGNATQGITWITHNGIERMFISQRVGGASWGVDERVRFSEWRWVGDGGDMEVVAFTAPLAVGHGADLSVLEEDGVLYLYTTIGNLGTISGGVSAGGKGYSKTEWKGTATTQADVQNFRLFGDPGDGSYLFWPQRASVCTTNDGKYVLVVATSNVGTGRFFFVYDRAEVEAAGEFSSTVRPITGPVPFERAPGETGSTLQGMTSDGKHLYTVWGTGAVRSSKSIQIYDMAGRLRRTIPYGAAGSIYTENELMGLSALGIPVSFEPEGICLRNGELLTLSVDAWKAPGDIVPYAGCNWASINTTAKAGREPTNRAGWVITKLPANHAAYSETYAYVAGAYSRRAKRIMRIAMENANDLPMQLQDATTGTMKEYYAGTDIAYNAENGSFTIAKFYEALGTYKKFGEFNHNNTFNLFSTTTDTDNTRWVSMKSQWDSSMYGMQLRSSGGNAAGGANIDMHAVDCPVRPGELTLSSTDTAVVRLRNGSVTAATADGQCFAFFVDTEVRSTTDKVVRLGGLNNNWRAVHSQEYCVDVSTCRIMSGIGSPESVVTAQTGSIYMRRDNAGTTSLWTKTKGTGNTGWRVVAVV